MEDHGWKGHQEKPLKKRGKSENKFFCLGTKKARWLFSVCFVNRDVLSRSLGNCERRIKRSPMPTSALRDVLH